MTPTSKHLRRLLREWAAQSYEAELGAELNKLANHFDAWKNGKLTSFDLNDKIHEFHDGPHHKLYFRYAMQQQPEVNIAFAIVEGFIQKESVPAELLQYLENEIHFYENQKNAP